MPDPFETLRRHPRTVDPDPAFAAALRERLQRALRLPRGVQPMTTATTHPRAAGGPDSSTGTGRRSATISAYLAVHDARTAITWYTEVFGAGLRGRPYVMDDDRIGHAELVIGESVLMLADEFDEVRVDSPRTRGGTTVSLMITVSDVDEVVDRAVAAGAVLERAPRDADHGRNAAVLDPFGHRWLICVADPKPDPDPAPGPDHDPGPAADTGSEQDGARRGGAGDLGYVTLQVPDADRARRFFGAVLGWQFSPGRVADGWGVRDASPMTGLHGGHPRSAAKLMYQVDDLEAAIATVRALGGTVAGPTRQPYGLTAECVDDQGYEFWLLQA
jgi:uncharacterized glyoxalase superfamily protein PhnB